MDVEAVPLLAIHHGLVALRARPQVFFRFESVTGASPDTSEASAVTLKWWPGGAAGAAPTVSRAVAIAAASAARTKRCMGIPPPFSRSGGHTQPRADWFPARARREPAERLAPLGAVAVVLQSIRRCKDIKLMSQCSHEGVASFAGG